MKPIFAAFFILFLTSFVAKSQTLERLNVPFLKKNGTPYLNPLAGGINVPQFSEIDLNGDGIKDLFVFDRQGNVVSTFLNGGTPNQVDYHFAPEFVKFFPTTLKRWVLLRDYNGDGIPDIFCYAPNGVDGVQVWKGKRTNNQLSFSAINDYLKFPISNGDTNIYISGEDYPAVDDMDGDGDLDILTFAPGGGHVFLYKNKSIELGFGKDSLRYELTDECWGKFYESGFDPCLKLSPGLDSCRSSFAGDGVLERHAGSTLLTMDMDGDGDKDLFLGDISWDNISYAKNGGTPQNAWVSQNDCFFPNYDTAVVLPIFPACYALDINNDGKKDFLATPNKESISPDYEVIWYYQNTTNNQNPKFHFQKRTLLTDEMLDFGTGASPTFADFNADGLLDIVIGNFSYFRPFGNRDPRLILYKNVGTATAPKYQLWDDDWLQFSQYSSTSTLSPAFGDLDSDGDLDLLVGEEYGQLFYLPNTGGAGNPMQFLTKEFGYKSIDVGLVATPQIIDVDRDGLKDLIIGERNGNLNFFKNTGTLTNPMFSNVATNEFLGGVDARENGSVSGFSAPQMLDLNGKYTLFCGSELGGIRRYGNIDNNLGGAFTKLDQNYKNILDGSRSHIAIADIDGDGRYDMLVGNHRGGLTLFRSNFNTNGTNVVADAAKNIDFQYFPNPNNGIFRIITNENLPTNYLLEIHNYLGQKILSQMLNADNQEIRLDKNEKGLFFITITSIAEAKIIATQRLFVE